MFWKVDRCIDGLSSLFNDVFTFNLIKLNIAHILLTRELFLHMHSMCSGTWPGGRILKANNKGKACFMRHSPLHPASLCVIVRRTSVCYMLFTCFLKWIQATENWTQFVRLTPVTLEDVIAVTSSACYVFSTQHTEYTVFYMHCSVMHVSWKWIQYTTRLTFIEPGKINWEPILIYNDGLAKRRQHRYNAVTNSWENG